MTIDSTDLVRYHSGQGRIRETLKNVGYECISKYGGPPNLFVVILPEGGTEIYTEVKQCVFKYIFHTFAVLGNSCVALETSK